MEQQKKKKCNRPDKIQSERISVSLTSNACVCKPLQNVSCWWLEFFFIFISFKTSFNFNKFCGIYAQYKKAIEIFI